MVRRLSLLAGGLLVLLVLAATGLYAFRTTLAEALLQRQVAAQGISPVHATVADIGLTGLRVEDVTLGPTLTIQNLSVTYRLSELLDGSVDSVVLEEPQLTLDLSGDGPLLGPLERLASGGPGGADTSIPAVEVVGGRLDAASPSGPLSLAIDGRLRPLAGREISLESTFRLESPFGVLAGSATGSGDPGGAFQGSLAIDQGTLAHPLLGVASDGMTGAVSLDLDRGQPHHLTVSLAAKSLSVDRLTSGQGQIALDLNGSVATLDAAVRSDDGAIDLALTAEGQRDGGHDEVRLQGRARVDALSKLGPLVPRLPGFDGGFQTSFDLSGRLPARDLTELDLSGLHQQILHGGVLGKIALRADHVGLENWLQGGRAQASADISLSDQSLKVVLGEPATLEVDRLEPDALVGLGLPEPLAELLSSGAMIDLVGSGDRPTLLMSQRPDSFEIEITAAPALTLSDGARIDLSGDLRAMVLPDFTVAEYSIQDLSLKSRDFVLDEIETDSLTVSGQLTGEANTLDLSGMTAAVTGAAVDGTPFPPTRVTGALSLTTTPLRLSGTLHLESEADRYSIGDVDLRDVTLDVPIALSMAEGALTAKLTDPGSFRAAAFTVADKVDLASGGGLTLEQADLSVPLKGPGPLAFALRLKPKPRSGPWVGMIDQDGSPPLQLQLRPELLGLSGTLDDEGRLRTEHSARFGSFSFPDYDLALGRSRLTGRMDHAGGRADATLRVDSLGLRKTLGLSQALGLAGRITLAKRRITFDGALSGRAPLDQTRVEASHHLDRGNGGARVTLGGLQFAPGSLQPGDLSTLLTALSKVEGEAAASAEVAWHDDGLESAGHLTLSDLSLTLADQTLTGLDLDLRLDDLIRLRSPRNQILTLDRLVGPVTVESLKGRFQIQPGTPARLQIDNLDFRSIGGDFTVPGLVLDPSKNSHEGILEVRSLDLERLARALEIDGLSGTGNLKGQIPLRFEDGRLEITDARLQSTEPGILRYKSTTSESLVEGVRGNADLNSLDLVNDPFRLTLLALENFHYDSLGIRMGHEAGGKANLKLALEGKNPDVLDGYPFELNVNLDTNLVPLLEALDDGLLVTKDLLPGKWSFGR